MKQGMEDPGSSLGPAEERASREVPYKRVAKFVASDSTGNGFLLCPIITLLSLYLQEKNVLTMLVLETPTLG